jgi:hypothetical protein
MTDEEPEYPLSPRQGDILFRGDLPDWDNNTVLGHGHHEEHGYTEGYRRGAHFWPNMSQNIMWTRTTWSIPSFFSTATTWSLLSKA